MRALLDVNILISALLSRRGGPAQLLTRWLAGEFELVVSEALLSELERPRPNAADKATPPPARPPAVGDLVRDRLG